MAHMLWEANIMEFQISFLSSKTFMNALNKKQLLYGFFRGVKEWNRIYYQAEFTNG